ncbi:MAG: hypothetical protein ACKVTZ_18110 [Bacteroidia bacterium]
MAKTSFLRWMRQLIHFSKLIALKMPVVRAASAALHWQKLHFCADAAAKAAATESAFI